MLLLHDDAEVEAGWMEALVSTADDHPEAGAVGGKVLHPDGRLQNAGMILWSDAYTSPPWVGSTPPPTAFDRQRAVDYCGTSSLLVRASGWDAVGGLNEELYPVYYVDVDLSMGLRNLGFVVLYQPASRIRHHQGASGDPHFRSFASRTNRLVFITKWWRALDRHEPPARNSPAAVERAMARADAFWEQRRYSGPSLNLASTKTLPVKKDTLDLVTEALKPYERNRTFQNAYIKHLTGALKRAEDELLQTQQKLK
jgi:GT2 family glycosyltransferase